MYIVQFHTDEERFRLVQSALMDAYVVGDRLMEGVLFEVSVTDGTVSVKATEDTKGYIKSFYGDVAMWEKRVLDFLKNGYDYLFLVKGENGWDRRELHLVDSLDFYLEDGMKQEENG